MRTRMLIRRAANATIVWCMISGGMAMGQTPQTKAPAAAKKSAPAAAPSNAQVQANLLQLMRGTLYPASNVVFAAQNDDPAKVPQAKEASTAPNPLESVYGQWQAVENAGLAIAEVANLLMLPGRKCANGTPVPLQNPNWAKFVQGLREAGKAAYVAAQSKDQDKMVDASGTLAEACANCHDVYREKKTPAERCR